MLFLHIQLFRCKGTKNIWYLQIKSKYLPNNFTALDTACGLDKASRDKDTMVVVSSRGIVFPLFLESRMVAITIR